MPRKRFEIEDEPNADHPDELGLRDTSAIYDPPDAPPATVTIRGTEHRGTNTWAVWIETADGVIETVDEHLRDVGGGA